MVRAGDGSATGQHRLLPLWGLLGGLVAGAAGGALARLWMRLITTEDPEFTWSGTLFVVGVFGVTGMLGGLVHGARRRHWRGRPMVALRLLGVLPLVLLVAGPGAVLAPTLVFGGLALGRTSWPRWVRAVLAVVALSAVAAVHVGVAQDWPHSTARLLAALVLCLVAWGGAAVALAQSFAPAPGAALPRAVAWLALPLLLLPVVLVVGLRSEPGTGALPAVAGGAALLVGAVVLVRRRRRAARQVPSPVPPSVPPSVSLSAGATSGPPVVQREPSA